MCASLNTTISVVDIMDSTRFLQQSISSAEKSGNVTFYSSYVCACVCACVRMYRLILLCVGQLLYVYRSSVQSAITNSSLLCVFQSVFKLKKVLFSPVSAAK